MSFSALPAHLPYLHTCLSTKSNPTPEGTSPLTQLVPCTAGVAHNKILAKFASGMHKPAQQTIVTLECVPGLMAATPIPKLRQLGGKFGEEIMHALHISTVGEECSVPKLSLETHHPPSEVSYSGIDMHRALGSRGAPHAEVCKGCSSDQGVTHGVARICR